MSPHFLNTQETLLRALYDASTHTLEKRERERESFIFFFFLLCEKPFYPDREIER